MRGCMCRRVGAGVQVLCGSAMCAGMMRYADMHEQAIHYADMHERAGMCYAAGDACKMVKNGAKRAKNRGIVDILYDGFRKCFVNCKFTFYITLSSYLKKVKIPKTCKNHSKM